MQRALMQYRLPQNYDLVMEALKKAGRHDLIGFDKQCLIRPRQMQRDFQYKGGKPGAGKGAPKGNGKGGAKGGDQKKPAKKKTIRNVHKKKG